MLRKAPSRTLLAAASPGSRMRRITFLTLLAAALLLAPAPAFAGDSLLSGYGGPGGGEQVILGSKLLTGKKGDGSVRSKGATPPVVSRSSPLPAGGPAAGLEPLAAAPSTKGGASGHRSGGTRAATGAESGGSSPSPAVHLGATLTTKPLAASRTSGDAGSPLGGDDLLLLGLGALALALTAVGTRRLVAGSGPSRPGTAA